MSVQGWHRITSGMYKYTNAAGKTLAYVEKSGSGHWGVAVLPLADPARSIRLPDVPKTYREAKDIAERAYRAASTNALKADAAALARFNRL